MNHPSIFSLYTDRQGTIWIGSFYGGVNYFTPDRSGFVHYDYQAGNLSNLYYSYIGEMTADKHGNLWVSTDGGGLGCINENWELVHQFTAGGLNSIPHNNVKSICYDQENDYLYIGTHLGGLSRYDFQKKAFIITWNISWKILRLRAISSIRSRCGMVNFIFLPVKVFFNSIR